MNKEILVSALKAAQHYYDFETNILYMTPAFEKKSNTYGTDEYNLLNDILDQQPGIRLEVYKSERGASDLITYAMMESFIDLMPNAEDYLEEYLRVKQKSRAYRSSYKFVTEWFKSKFPYYTKLLKKNDEGKLVWNTESWNELLTEYVPGMVLEKIAPPAAEVKSNTDGTLFSDNQAAA